MLVMLQLARMCRAAIILHGPASVSSLSQTSSIEAHATESPDAAKLHISSRTAMNSRNKALKLLITYYHVEVSSTLHTSHNHNKQLIPSTSSQLTTLTPKPIQNLKPSTPTTMSGRTGGASGGRGAGAGAKTSAKSSREAAPKGVEKKVAKQPVKAIKEKFVVAKEKAKAKKEAMKASHNERKAKYDDDQVARLKTAPTRVNGKFSRNDN